MSHASRRLLGYHTKPRDRSLLEYSRDGMAGPLRDLCKVLLSVKSGVFRPDSTRSGRWGDVGRAEAWAPLASTNHAVDINSSPEGSDCVPHASDGDVQERGDLQLSRPDLFTSIFSDLDSECAVVEMCAAGDFSEEVQLQSHGSPAVSSRGRVPDPQGRRRTIRLARRKMKVREN